jgi:hypothetical protein
MTVRISGTNTTAAPGFQGGDSDTGIRPGTNEIEFVTGGSVAATFNSSGNLVFPDTQGIDFSASEGSGSSSSILDDYEEGSWTPVLGVTDGNSTHDQANQLGFYVKVGRKVTVWARAQISNLNNNGNGVCSMNGLPFTARTSALTEGGPVVVFSEGFDTNFVPQATRLNTNSDKLTFVCFGGADRERITSTLGSGRYTSTSEIMIQGSYYTD